MSYLVFKDVSYTYPGKNEPAVKGVSLNIPRGQKIIVFGCNGSGKSTLAKLMLGLLKPEHGIIKLENKSIQDYSLPQIGRKLGYISQNPSQMFFNTTVYNEIAFGLRWRGINSSEIYYICKTYLEYFGIWPLRERLPFNLSEGQKQVVVLISLLVLDPAYLILDEPTKNLDTKSKEKLLTILEDVFSRGKGIIVITHDNEFAQTFNGRIIKMDKGEVCHES